MDGVEQLLLLQRVSEALNHAGPFDALACQGMIVGCDSVSEVRGDGRAMHHGGRGPSLFLYPGENRYDLILINEYTAYFTYRFYIINYMTMSAQWNGPSATSRLLASAAKPADVPIPSA